MASRAAKEIGGSAGECHEISALGLRFWRWAVQNARKIGCLVGNCSSILLDPPKTRSRVEYSTAPVPSAQAWAAKRQVQRLWQLRKLRVLSCSRGAFWVGGGQRKHIWQRNGRSINNFVHFFACFKISGWCFGTFFIFPYIGNNNPN